jgi:hypothetical protein
MSETIHIKLDYSEALQAKKDVLGSELGLLKIARAIKNHQVLRSDELKMKLRLHRKLKELKTTITKLQQVLPKVKIPEILEDKEDKEEKKEDKKQTARKRAKERAHDISLEVQLQEIQERLKQLG